jgi:unsaturated rhamnogalacturonyl hydrolase
MAFGYRRYLENASALAVASGLLVLGGCGKAEQSQALQVTVRNPSDDARYDAAVAVDLGAAGIPIPQDATLVVRDGKRPIPSQFADTNGDGIRDVMWIVTDFAPGESRNFTIKPGIPDMAIARTQAEVSVKEGGHWEGQRYVGGQFVNVNKVVTPPDFKDHAEYIRYEGPGIESDRVGYRFYLDWRNGFDIFGKKTRAMVLQNVGQDGYESYHEPADWGMDILKVGDSLGIGAFGYWNGSSVERVSDVETRTARILDRGPLYSMLEILYDEWHTSESQTDVKALLSMSAGSRLVHVRLTMSEPLSNIAIGIVKEPAAELIDGSPGTDGGYGYFATWGKQSLSGPDDDLGMLLLYRQADVVERAEDELSHVVVLRPTDGKVEYWFGAAWSQEPDGITTAAGFTDYLRHKARQLEEPLEIELPEPGR